MAVKEFIHSFDIVGNDMYALMLNGCQFLSNKSFCYEENNVDYIYLLIKAH